MFENIKIKLLSIKDRILEISSRKGGLSKCQVIIPAIIVIGIISPGIGFILASCALVNEHLNNHKN